MKFSLVIPTYNRANAVAEAVKSALNQTFADFEIIVVDDGSTDNTSEMVKAISDPRLSYYYKTNGERGAARNFGIQKAKGEYIGFLDSDDVLYPNHFSVAEDVIAKHNNLEVFHVGYEVKDVDGKILWDTNHQMPSANEVLIKGNLLSCNGVFIRIDIAKANAFNEDRALSGLEDWELWLRLSAKYTIHMDSTVTSCIINHESRSVLSINRDKLMQRVEALIKYVTSDKGITSHYGRIKMNQFKASCYTYCALHLAMAKYKRDAFPYLIKGINTSPASVFSKRFLVILKYLIS